MSDIAASVLADLRDKTACVMEAVRAENPDHWPAGLRVGMFDAVHPVISGIKLAGFVGWQVIDHPAGHKAGYYSVGILPEFRRQGLAKKACERLIAQHKGEVAQVRAFIVDGNAASEKLAKALGVEVDHHDPREKQASALLRLLGRNKGSLIGGAAGVGLGEVMSRLEHHALIGDENPKMDFLSRAVNLPVGGIAGLLAGSRMPALKKLLALSPVALGYGAKTMGIGGLDAYTKNAPIEAETAKLNLEAAKSQEGTAKTLAEQANSWSPTTKLLAGALGLGGLGLGIYGYNSLKGKGAPKTTTKLQSDPALRRKSKLRIDIPADAVGKDFYDQLSALTSARRGDASFTAPTPEPV